MRRVCLALLGATLAACQAVSTPSASVGHAGAAGLASARPQSNLTAPLAHEGGIVFIKPITAIANAKQQAAATTLGIELAAQLRAERAMRDAGLLASGAATSAPYTLMAEGPDGPGAPPPPPGPAPWFADDHPGGPGGEPRARVHEEERTELDSAHSAWLGLSPDEREEAEQVHGDRDRQLRERYAPQLAAKANVFQRAGLDQTASATTGKTVMTAFNVRGTSGGIGRTLTVTRTYDAQGSLVQAVETLVGNLDGLTYDCERARTLKPDGTEAIAMDIRLTIDGTVHAVRWAKTVSADGRPSGTGTIVRPDGTEVALTSTATAALLETIAGKDASGLQLTVTADATQSTAKATLDAGAGGSAELEIDVDQL